MHTNLVVILAYQDPVSAMVRTIIITTMSFYKIKEVAEIAVNRAVDETEEVLDAARKFYCNLHQNHPAWTVARTFSNSSLILRAIDRMCGDGTYVPPPQPVPPYTGGQCDTLYHAFGTFASLNLTSCRQQRFWRTRDPLNGNEVESFEPIIHSDGFWRIQMKDGTVRNLNTISQASYDSDALGTLSGASIFYRDYNLACPNVNVPQYGDRVVVDRVVRVDGQPDDCGNPPTEYPPESPPTDNDLTNTVNVTNIENNTYTYDVTVNRDTNNTINFPPSITVNSVVVNMDITGISVGDTTNINLNSGGNFVGVFPPPPVETEDENAGKELVTEAGTFVETVSNIYAVIVNFTAIPFNAKISSGANAPRIIYGGWVEFRIGANYLPREYIDFDNSTFLAPKGATGYAVTIKLGYTASIFKQFYRETTDGS